MAGWDFSNWDEGVWDEGSPTTAVATPAQIASALASSNMRLEFAFEQRTKTFAFLNDLTPAVIAGAGGVGCDNRSAGAMRTLTGVQARAELLPMGFTPERGDTYLAVFADLQVPAVSSSYWHRFALGLFHLDEPGENLTPAGKVITLSGADLMVDLIADHSPFPFLVPSASDYGHAADGLIEARGFISEIAALGRFTPNGFSWPATASVADVVRDILAGVNYYPAWFDGVGRAQATERVDPIAITPAVSYGGASDPPMIVDVDVPRRRQATRQPNRCTVKVDDPRRPPFAAYAVNNDPGSPSSVASTGRTQPADRDIPTMIDAPTAEDFASVEILVAAAGGTEMTITTRPDPRRTGHEVYAVTLPGFEDATPWLVLSWHMDLSPAGRMTHILGPIEPVAVTVGIL